MFPLAVVTNMKQNPNEKDETNVFVWDGHTTHERIDNSKDTERSYCSLNFMRTSKHWNQNKAGNEIVKYLICRST